MNLKSIRIYLLAVVSLMLLIKPVLADKADPLTPITVQINWHHQYQFAGFYAAIAQGYYRNAGLDVTIKTWQPGMNIREEVVSGRATFGTAYSSVIADFIQGHPIKAVMTSFQYSPMVLLSKEPINELSQLSGKSVSHYNNLQILALLHRASPEITKPNRTFPPTGNLQDFIQGYVDLYGAYETNEPFQLNDLNESYYLVKPTDFGVNSLEDLVIVSREFAANHPNVVNRFREATIKGWQYAIQNQQEMVDYILANYRVIKSRQALMYEARATTKYVRVGDTPIGSLDPARLLATAAEIRDVGLINAADFARFNPADLISYLPDSRSLTQEERDYLTNNPVIKIGNDIEWPPFEFINQKGEYAGLAADYFKLFEQRLGVRFEYVTDQTWSNVVRKMQRKELDILSAATPTPDRLEYLNFTRPYLSFPMVLAGRQNTLFINDYHGLVGQRVAVVRDYWSHEYLRTHYPEIELYLVNNVSEGLEAVLKGHALVYSGNLAVINYTLRQRGITGLQIVGQSDQRFELAMGVHKDNPILLSILQKTLDNITPDEHDRIYRNWINLELVTRLDQRQLTQISLVVTVIVLMMLAWVLTYRMQKKHLQRYIHQVHELTYASAIDPKTYQTCWASRRYCELTGYSENELKEICFTDLAGPDMTVEKIQVVAKQVMSGQSWTGEVEGRTKGGQLYWVELTLTPQKNLWGEVDQVLATRVDISDKKRVEELSIKDELTRLYNRRYLTQMLPSEMGRLQRKHASVAFALFDLDHFKMINDNHGHEWGDQALRAVSDLVVEYFNRGDDFLFRLGGEEFLIMTNDVTPTQFENHLKRFCEGVVALQIENKGTPLGYLSVSIGAGVWPATQVHDFTDVYGPLDQALYRAKHQGRNQVVMVKDSV
ncbi:diguanylate cyclase [Thiomicrospira microaerophila]|uniref:diguanylate cyclase n=1 Tax=Thiomicrospira microaerophila TaxID=406020 RepID=UPI00069804BC|nr:transporter substrate-binding domain-containing protein [Thiomicrospira microaerophila]